MNKEQIRRNLMICRWHYRDGLRICDIARKVGLTRQRVFAILKRYGIPSE